MDTNVGRFFCQFCDRYYSEKRSLKRHVNVKHSLLDRNAVNEIEIIDDELLIDNYEITNNVDESIYEQNFEEVVEDEHVEELFTSGRNIFSNGNHKNFKATSFDDKYLKILLKYLSKPEIPRKYVLNITNDFSKLLENNLSSQTESNINRLLINLNLHIKAKTITISSQREPYIDTHNQPQLRSISYEIKLYPLIELFSKIFQKTNISDIIIEYCESLTDNEVLTDFTQSVLFKKVLTKVKREYPDSKQFILPLFFYIDEFEPNNPLGSRATYKKVGGLYSKIPCLPLLFQSKMFNIFELMFFHSNDRKSLGNSRLFVDLTNEFNALTEFPIVIEHPRFSHIRLVPSLMMGDNLGLNQYTDRTENFNDDFCCRICFISRSHEGYYFSCTEDFLYTRNTYEENIGKPNSSVKSDSIFNQLKYFHVIENPSIDPMHDDLEGFCKYDLILILYICVKVKKYFTIEYLNQRILSVVVDGSNKPPLINIDFSKKQKSKLKMSAAEMRVFIKAFSIYIGNKVQRDEECWILFLLMRHIEAISFSKFIYKKKTSDFLKSIIPLHNRLYWKLYDQHFRDKSKILPYVKMPFKFHVITHYPYVMENVGPLGHVHCMRFEQAHQVPKKTIASTKCTINILETMVKKTNFKFSDLLMNFSEKTDIAFRLGPRILHPDDEINIIKNTFNFYCSNDLYFYKYLIFNSLVVEPDLVIKIDGHGSDCRFVIVRHIIKYLNNVYLLIQKLKTVCFDEFMFAFEIDFLEYHDVILFEDISHCLEHTSYMYRISSKTFIVFNDYYYYENE